MEACVGGCVVEPAGAHPGFTASGRRKKPDKWGQELKNVTQVCAGCALSHPRSAFADSTHLQEVTCVPLVGLQEYDSLVKTIAKLEEEQVKSKSAPHAAAWAVQRYWLSF